MLQSCYLLLQVRNLRMLLQSGMLQGRMQLQMLDDADLVKSEVAKEKQYL